MLRAGHGARLQRFVDILRGNLAVNLAVVLALGVGFFHGWLKLKIRHPATTFAFDFFLLIALVLVYLRCGSLGKLIPPGPVGRALIILYTLCAIYLPFSLLPGIPPPLLAVIAIRSWAFGTLMYCVGYHMIQSPQQMRLFYLLTIGLSLAAAVYGFRQTPQEILALMQEDEYYAERYMNQTYATSRGSGVRISSTFVSSAGYGSTLACAMIFALALATDLSTRPWQRWMLLAVMVPLAYGVAQSGARSALATAALGCGVVLLLRRHWIAAVLTAIILAGAVIIAGKATGGVLLERFNELSRLDSVALRFVFPALIGMDYVLEGHPLGGGLGKSGFAPMFLKGRTVYHDFVGADGDLGKLLIELGIPGLIVIGYLLWTTGKLNWLYLRQHLSSPVGSLLLAGAINFYITVLCFPIGSPYIGIPLGMLTWFMLGGSQKLVELMTAIPVIPGTKEHATALKTRFGLTGPLPLPDACKEALPHRQATVSPITKTPQTVPSAKVAGAHKRFLYLSQPEGINSAAGQPDQASQKLGKGKRFLYLNDSDL